MNRREFIGGCVALAAYGCRTGVGRDGYSVVILGDTHFDAEPA